MKWLYVCSDFCTVCRASSTDSGGVLLVAGSMRRDEDHSSDDHGYALMGWPRLWYVEQLWEHYRQVNRKRDRQTMREVKQMSHSKMEAKPGQQKTKRGGQRRSASHIRHPLFNQFSRRCAGSHGCVILLKESTFRFEPPKPCRGAFVPAVCLSSVQHPGAEREVSVGRLVQICIQL